MKKLIYGPSKFGKTAAMVEAAKAAQMAGKRVLWATGNQTSTAALLSKHGALSEIVGESFVAPHFRKDPHG